MKETGLAAKELNGILKNVSRTLYLSIRILPERVREPMALGYLVARAMDTVVDCPAIGAPVKREILELCRGLEKAGNEPALKARIKTAAAGVEDGKERELLLKFEKVAELYRSFPERELSFLKALVGGVADGMLMDLDNFDGRGVKALASAADLQSYCSLIGGEPGVFWARLYREAIRRNDIVPGRLPSEGAAALIGAALQITNVLKDMAADLSMGRCYLPREELAAAALRPEDLLKAGSMKALRPVVNRWIAWAVAQLDLSERFLASIPKTEPAMRAAFVWPVYWAMDTLLVVAGADILDPAARPRIGRGRVYSTIAATPSLLLSNTAFARGYRRRREALVKRICAVPAAAAILRGRQK